jgi:osmotically-inducible protein OsmY
MKAVKPRMNSYWLRTATIALLIGAAATVISGCVPLVATGAAVGTMSLADRRTTGAQTEDQTIELKAFNRIRQNIDSKRVSVSVTSFNRIVLVTGYAPTEALRSAVIQQVTAVENVRSVFNEIAVGPKPSIVNYGRDSFYTARVKAALVDTKGVPANVVKVHTELATVFLMGIVTSREATLAAEAASKVSGVRRVVQAFEIVSQEEIDRIQTLRMRSN